MIHIESLLSLFAYDAGAPVMFQTGTFLVLFVLFYTLYAIGYRSLLVRKVLVLAFSIYFYVMASGGYVVLLLGTIIFDYAIALWMSSRKNPLVQKWILGLSIVVNVALLGYFKYTNFLLDIVGFLRDGKLPHYNIFLPIGISFFTFQTISYKVDVYQGKLTACKSLVDYAFYITFFPHLVAGPIVRARDFLYQINSGLILENAFINQGIYLILKGYVKKAILADYVAQYVDLVYARPEAFSGFEHLMAVYGYTLQIFCDFSGYTDMAIGIAAIMGFKLCENFDSPYKSTNITDFWRRWHISLSSWLRDYIYIPLGGNRKGKFMQQVNQLLTMLIGGLWHGASLRFVVWGGAHGLALISHKLWNSLPFTKTWDKYLVPRFLVWLLTFHVVAALWMLFRIDSWDTLQISLEKMGTDTQFVEYAAAFWVARPLFIVVLVLGFSATLLPSSWKAVLQNHIVNAPMAYKVILFLLAIHIALEMSGQGIQPFIYFQF